jgi:hypothetical protein
MRYNYVTYKKTAQRNKTIAQSGRPGPLASEPILPNRFGRNLRVKSYLVEFKFVIMNSYSFKLP